MNGVQQVFFASKAKANKILSLKDLSFPGTTLILTDPRFNVDLDKSTSTYTLRIEDIQETDGATYQCQVIIALTDKEQADVPLIVRRPPIISGNNK